MERTVSRQRESAYSDFALNAYCTVGASLEIHKSIYGENHRNSIIAMSNIGGILRDQGDFEAAAELSAEALERCAVAFPEGHWITGALRTRHAESLHGLGEYEEAVRLASEAYDIVFAALGDTTDWTKDASRALTRIYESWNETDPTPEREEAERMWRERARPTEPAGD